MKTRNLTLLLIALLVTCCAETFTSEDTNPQIKLTERGIPGIGFIDGGCDPDFEFPVIHNNTPGFHSVIVRYDSTLTEEEVICARYDFFQTYPRLYMALLQSTDIHVDNWMVSEELMFPKTVPNRLRVSEKVEVETAICIDPRTETADCPD